LQQEKRLRERGGREDADGGVASAGCRTTSSPLPPVASYPTAPPVAGCRRLRKVREREREKRGN
jgi:hypothetical protein